MASHRQSTSLPTFEGISRPEASRRRKSNRERVRVTRACDRCKRRKIKCNNTQPCGFCLRAKARCTFDSAYSRGRNIFIPSVRAHGNEGQRESSELMLSPAKNSSVSTSPYQENPSTTRTSQNNSQSIEDCDDYPASSPASPVPPQTDLQGHYIGPASGISFLLRIQRRLHQAISFSKPSSIFTFGDAPLDVPEFDPSFCMMLPRDDAQRLVDRYFDFVMPTYRFLHRPTVQKWFNEFYDTLGVMRDAHNAPAKVALLFMVFSLARVYMTDNDRPGPSDLSTRYYLAAEHQLAKEKGSIRLTSVQARLTQCYYLLSQSRINHCWSLFGTVSHLALAIGLNTNRCPDISGGMDLIEVECRRRTFWCAYTLDTYLSAALGRPRSFHDEDINTELPTCVEDQDITASHIGSHTPTSGPSAMLARIIGTILRNLYSIQPVSESRRAAAVKTISKDLTEWRAELAWFLDAHLFSTSLLIPIFQRQRNVLNLTYWQAIILTHRPFVLRNFGRLSQQDQTSFAYKSPQAEQSVKQCLHAAMKTVEIMDDISQNRQLFRALWITSYFAFNATVMLYIYVIQKRAFPPEVYSSYLSAATRCQSHLSGIAEQGSLSERYCLVLEELRVEATRQTNYMTWSENSVENIYNQAQDQTASKANRLRSSNDSTDTTEGPMMDLFSTVPGLSLDDCADWGQFTTMVSSGLGNIDVSINEDLFRQ
ncbi:fungal-specific transcription factor domain-containing protein [Aspergillus floccosus]